MSPRTCSSFVEKVRPVLARMDDPKDGQPARFDPVDDETRSRTANTNGRPELPPLSRDLGIEEEPVEVADDRADTPQGLTIPAFTESPRPVRDHTSQRFVAGPSLGRQATAQPT